MLEVNAVHASANKIPENTSHVQAVSGSFDKILTGSKQKQSEKSLEDIFKRAGEKYHVDPNLLKAIAKQESNFKSDLVSKCGAVGIMQLMPCAQKSLGVKDAKDPEQNIMGGAKLISQFLDKYDGDVRLALAAYNAGAGNVAKYGGVPPFKETQAYIKKVLANYESMPKRAAANQGAGSAAETEPVSASAKQTYVGTVRDGTHAHRSAPAKELLTESSAVSLADSFAYNDYMKFIDIFMKYFSNLIE